MAPSGPLVQQVPQQGTFNSLESFASFVRSWPWQWSRKLGNEALNLCLPELDLAFQAKVAKRLSHYISCCGCQLGSFFVIGAMIWRIPIFVDLSSKTLGEFCVLVGTIVAAGILGKLLGLAIAKSLFYIEALWLIRFATREQLTSNGVHA